MKKILSNYLTIALLAVYILGCKGKDGKDGVPGPAGNANVKNYSITVKPSDWKYDNSYEQWYYDYNVTDVNFQSAVYGYVMSGNGKQAMPYINQSTGNIITFADNLFYTNPYVQFQYVNLESESIRPANDQYLYLVIIPSSLRTANINYKNYDEVKAFFNLKD